MRKVEQIELIQKIMDDNHDVLLALAYAEDAENGVTTRFSLEEWEQVENLLKAGDTAKLSELYYKLAINENDSK